MTTSPVSVSQASAGPLAVVVSAGAHQLLCDVPTDLGGTGLAADPHELLHGALAACTAQTILMYAQRKGWPVADVGVAVEGEMGGSGYVLRRRVQLSGVADEAQRQRLLEIANKCPIHRILSSSIRIETEAAA